MLRVAPPEHSRQEEHIARAASAVNHPGETAYLYETPGHEPIRVELSPNANSRPIGILPGVTPARLGDPSMADVHGVRYPYICGEMANGIASTDLVQAITAQGMMGFFGAAGLSLERIEAAIIQLRRHCGDALWGSNLIHSPQDPELEEGTVDLYLRHGVHRVSASAFLGLPQSVVRYACSGLRTAPDGSVIRQNHVFAKISRPEVAKQFLSPAPEAMLQALVAKGQLSSEEAALARAIPIAGDITVEGDSGGHTDNRPINILLPAILRLRDEVLERFRICCPIRVGVAGGIGTPAAVAAAFALGAEYVMTGSINQCTRESGQSEPAKQMLAQADVADCMMAPAGDMFELGAKVQVLKRGSLFPVRAAKLYELYRQYRCLEQMPQEALRSIERDIFRQSVADVWRETREYFLRTKPGEVERAERDPRHRMALLFRWYLGKSSVWPLEAHRERSIDFQIWCGPAMGAFNRWVKGSFLEDPANRTVGEIALNLMHGAASITRAHQLRSCGVQVAPALFHYAPRMLSEAAAANA